ncbi:hypothetical protein VCHA39O220_20057 [Vibrio chagasii]|nr:hypothetical protein VCHA35O137_30056 [Vibrio chagasii]CAH7131931.1 hypothetical protein VCHA39O220_20057 [Vibrio chagasii]
MVMTHDILEELDFVRTHRIMMGEGDYIIDHFFTIQGVIVHYRSLLISESLCTK